MQVTTGPGTAVVAGGGVVVATGGVVVTGALVVTTAGLGDTGVDAAVVTVDAWVAGGVVVATCVPGAVAAGTTSAGAV